MKRRREMQNEAGSSKKPARMRHFRSGSVIWSRIQHYDVAWLWNGHTGKQKVVKKLKWKMRTRFPDKLTCRRKFSEKWIVGAKSMQTSNMHIHANNNQHKYAMSLLKKEWAKSSNLGPASYALIVKEFSKLPENDIERLTEKLPYTKYPKVGELQAHHGVQVGMSYWNENAGKDFMHWRCTLPRQNGKFYYESSRRPSSSLYCWMSQLIKTALTMKSCGWCAVIPMRVIQRSTTGWIISWRVHHSHSVAPCVGGGFAEPTVGTCINQVSAGVQEACMCRHSWCSKQHGSIRIERSCGRPLGWDFVGCGALHIH